MISVLFYAAAIAQSDPVLSTQRRVDELVRQCAAAKVIRLSAESGKQVAMKMLIVGRGPTRSENRWLTCVLNGLKTMKNLQFGFIGNEVEP